jgi:hypothetical protein
MDGEQVRNLGHVRIINAANGGRLSVSSGNTSGESEHATVQRQEERWSTDHWRLRLEKDGLYSIWNLGSSPNERSLHVDQTKEKERDTVRVRAKVTAQLWELRALSDGRVMFLPQNDSFRKALGLENPGDANWTWAVLLGGRAPSADRTWYIEDVSGGV